MKQIANLLQKDFLLEIRQQYSFYGMLLYIFSTVFVVYLTMGQPESTVWNSMFWIIQLFVCVNAVAKSFLQQGKGIMLYYYSVAGAETFILSKLIFNAFLMLVMSLLSLLIFTIFLGNPLQNALQFAGISILGGIGLSLLFTFLASIAVKAQQQAALMAIMGFPIVLPQLMLLSKISMIAFSEVIQGSLYQMILLLVCLDALIILLAIILFPFLWKD